LKDMKIRKATEKDLPAVLDIFNYEIIHTPYVYLYEAWTLEYITAWFKEKQETKFPFLIAEHDSVVLGYAYYSLFREKEAYNTSVEYTVYIHRDHRGKGAGYQLVHALIEIAKKQNIKTFIGGVDAGNAPSIAFHERMGFTQVAHMKSVAKKFDKWLDLIFYQLMLDEELWHL
jgi:L-amino acid N-acyltransferase YncA